ncbi:MAG: hypothetical protein U9R27_05580 [Campylobacterota bacterium]|nr:hypothetical protein [Campylobacterota bacterium]
MDIQEREIAKMHDEITEEVQLVFKKNMKVFDWDIPENDDRKSAELILSVMQKAMDRLTEDVTSGKYDYY